MAAIPSELFRRIRKIEISTKRLVDEMLKGEYHSAFKGNGMEFEEVRAYQPGDDIRSIDWNVTARSHFPYIKTFREERELTVFLVVDVSASSFFGSGDRAKRELIAEVGATLAFSAIQNNDNVGLILYSEEVEKYIPPRKGSRHVLRVIRDLLAFEPKKKGTNLEAALQFLGRVQRRMAVCFLLSDFFDFEKSSRALKITAKTHDLIAIHAVDPREKKLPKMGMVEFSDLETGKTVLVDTSYKPFQRQYQRESEKRDTKIKQFMRRIGADFVELQTDQSYATNIHRFFRERERRVRG